MFVNRINEIKRRFYLIKKSLNLLIFSAPVYETMNKCEMFNEKKKHFRLFPTVHDAVQCALSLYFQTISVISRV